MGNAGRNGGEHYTPRPFIRAIIQTMKPELGRKGYGGAVWNERIPSSVLLGLRSVPALRAGRCGAREAGAG